MTISSILIANRGEIAIRISRAAAELGLRSVAIYAQDDQPSLHTRVADEAVALDGTGVRAYLDIDAVVEAARASGCDAVHPGYGFLAERADFADCVEKAGLTFIGPKPEHLRLFGNKADARAAAEAAGVSVINGISDAVTLEEARAFLEGLPTGRKMIIKALAGGGGRGTRAVSEADELPAAFERCQSEALAAFGREDVFVEELMAPARHVEVQIVADHAGGVAHLGERECSVQRRYQKVIEVAPAPFLAPEVRAGLTDAAVRFARAVGYWSLGTFEFLIDEAGDFAFIETNARLQVEHTVTEAVTGIDLVQTQISIANGESLGDLGLTDAGFAPRGFAIQARVNMESVEADGTVRPSQGTLSVYEAPSGPGVRTDGFGYAGYRTSTAYDSLLAKVITHASGRSFSQAVGKSLRTLREFRIDGVATNIPFLMNVLEHEDFVGGRVHTRWVDENLAELAAPREDEDPVSAGATVNEPAADGFAGARVDTSDPLALFAHDAQVKATQDERAADQGADALLHEGPEGTVGLVAPIQGTIVSVDVATGDRVQAGQQVAVVEAMKMEHVIAADQPGIVHTVTMSSGDVVREGFPIVYLEPSSEAGEAAQSAAGEELDLDHIRNDLQEVVSRHALTLDENRPQAVERRRARGYRMPRENIAQLVDPGSFQEYWPLIVALQHQRHDIDALRRNTPADGVVAGTASVNGEWFDDDRSRAVIVSYDYTVLAGTQGRRNHYKQDRMFELANRFELPLILFSEGGGGRPGDDNNGPRVAFDTHTFTTFSKLSGLVPMVGINNGRCFAGNTALLACCDVIIATEASTIAMGGPAMIEGGGLGVYTPEEVGPMSFQVPNGVVDILVKDEEEAVDVAKKYLSYFQGPLEEWTAPDQRKLRHVVPENRVRLYDMRDVIYTLADEGSVLELREKFGIGVITAFIRIEGKPMGVIANNPHHLAGAIDSDGADKGARFLQLCDAFDIPVLSLMDCPGIMVGPDHERTALVRHSVRMFNTGANLTTPLFGVVVRKAYGLGVQAMCGASALVGFFTVAWPTAEFAGMNIEGSVKLGFRNELATLDTPEARKEEFDRRVDAAYETARAVNASAGGGIDDVIDPAETRTWIANSLRRLPPPPKREGKKYAYIDTW